MQRRQHEVTGHRRSQRNVRRFSITNLTHHQNVRVLAQRRAQHTGKIEVDLFVDLYLIDPLQLVFDGVFDRNNFLVDNIELLKSAIEGCGLTAARRSSDQNETVRHGDQAAETSKHLARHTHLVEISHPFGLIQQTHYD